MLCSASSSLFGHADGTDLQCSCESRQHLSLRKRDIAWHSKKTLKLFSRHPVGDPWPTLNRMAISQALKCTVLNILCWGLFNPIMHVITESVSPVDGTIPRVMVESWLSEYKQLVSIRRFPWYKTKVHQVTFVYVYDIEQQLWTLYWWLSVSQKVNLHLINS